MTRPSEYGPYTKDGITVTVWMAGYGLWEFYATRGGMYKYGTVEADNRIEAWNLAYDEARRSMWTAEEILEREG